MRFSDRETAGPERVFSRQFRSVPHSPLRGCVWCSEPELYQALPTTGSRVVSSGLSSRRVRSQGREDRTRTRNRTKLAVGGAPGVRENREALGQVFQMPGNTEAKGTYKGKNGGVESVGRWVTPGPTLT